MDQQAAWKVTQQLAMVQAVDTFEAALKRLTDVGVELVKFDMGLLSAEGAEVEAELLLAYEAPREIPRCTVCALTLDIRTIHF